MSNRHLTRQESPTKWPIERKGSVYLVRPNSNLNQGVPLLIVLREMLKLGQDRREVKSIIHSRHVLVNEKPATDEKNSILFLDTLRIIPTKKSYRLELSDKGKFYLNEIKENEADNKIAKIIDKRLLKGKKIQLNLSDGRNFLSDIKCETNDSLIINLKTGKIEKCLPLKEKAQVIIFSGKHAGNKGEIIDLDKKAKMAKIKTKHGEVNILIKQLMVAEEK